MANYIPTLKDISWFIILITGGIITFYTCWFYLGNEMTFENLKLNLLKNIVLRTVGGSLISIPSVILITFIELLGIQRNILELRTILSKIVFVFLMFILFALVGSMIFFFH